MNGQALMSAVEAALRPLRGRIQAIAARATISRVDDSGAGQKVQITVLAGERLSNVLRLQSFGFTGNPPAGCTGLAISIGGSRTHVVLLGGEDATRKAEQEPGESSQYNQWGDFLWLKTDGTAHLKARLKALVEAPEAEFTGNVTVNGTLHVVGAITGDSTAAITGALSSATSVSDPSRSMQQLATAHNTHAHPAGTPNTGTPTVTTP